MNDVTAKSSLQAQKDEPFGNEDNKQKLSSEEPSVVGCSHSSDAHCLEGSVEILTASTTESVVLEMLDETASNSARLSLVDTQKDSVVSDDKSRISEMDCGATQSPQKNSPAEQSQRLEPNHSNPKKTDRDDEKEDAAQHNQQDIKPSFSAEDAFDDKTQQDRGQVSHSASSEIEAVQDSVKPMEVVPQESYATFVILSHIVPCPCCAL